MDTFKTQNYKKLKNKIRNLFSHKIGISQKKKYTYIFFNIKFKRRIKIIFKEKS